MFLFIKNFVVVPPCCRRRFFCLKTMLLYLRAAAGVFFCLKNHVVVPACCRRRFFLCLKPLLLYLRAAAGVFLLKIAPWGKNEHIYQKNIAFLMISNMILHIFSRPSFYMAEPHISTFRVMAPYRKSDISIPPTWLPKKVHHVNF